MTSGIDHEPTLYLRQRVSDLAFTGIAQETMSKILGLSVETLVKYYRKELDIGEANVVNEMSCIASHMALNGNEKMLTLMLKTKGAKYGFVEKQVIETVDTKETEELQARVKALEKSHDKEY
jgi:hypothetical protein